MSTVKEGSRPPLKIGTVDEELRKPLKIGAGSFAAIYVVQGAPLAYKVVHFPEHNDILKKEFEALRILYASCNTDSFFRTPKPVAFYNADNDELILTPPSPVSARNRRIVLRPADIDASFFDELSSNNPVYAMSRIFALRGNIARPICSQFMPDSVTTLPNLCRLYFGKTLGEGKDSRFVNTNNFPLDVRRYEWLRATLKEKSDMVLPSAEEVALEMGEMLGKIHWLGGYDARDVEFVMGGDGLNGVLFYVLDFNQVFYRALVLQNVANWDWIDAPVGQA
jgi:hypothetical protein